MTRRTRLLSNCTIKSFGVDYLRNGEAVITLPPISHSHSQNSDSIVLAHPDGTVVRIIVLKGKSQSNVVVFPFTFDERKHHSENSEKDPVIATSWMRKQMV